MSHVGCLVLVSEDHVRVQVPEDADAEDLLQIAAAVMLRAIRLGVDPADVVQLARRLRVESDTAIPEPMVVG